MHKVVLLRHGASVWNNENKFAGWADVDLSTTGIEEARETGRLLKEEGFVFDVAFTSVLKRAIRTLWLILDEMNLMWIPVHRSWRLNERHYGELQGKNRVETTEEHGEEQVKAWRRGYDVPPPPLAVDDPRVTTCEPQYRSLDPKVIPRSESLKDTVIRALPYWHDQVAPSIRKRKSVLIVAHGNSIRTIIRQGKYLTLMYQRQCQ